MNKETAESLVGVHTVLLNNEMNEFDIEKATKLSILC